jgi:hypothetical protein
VASFDLLVQVDADAVQGLIGLPVYGGHGRGGRLLGDGFIEGGAADVFALAEVAFFGLDFMVFACGQANGDNFGGDFTGFTAAGSGHGLLRFVFVVDWGCPEGTPSGKLCLRAPLGALLGFRIRKHGLLFTYVQCSNDLRGATRS